MFRIREEEFTLSGRKLIFKGFLEIAPFLGAKDADVELPQFKDGDNCKIQSMSLNEKQTKPPDFLTEATLISYMEEHCIGTDASIPSHIKNIIE